YGNKVRDIRIPYDAHLKYLQRYFQPASVTFDIMLKSNLGEILRDHQLDEISMNSEVLQSHAMKINKLSVNADNLDKLSLLKLSSLLSEQGEVFMSSILAFAQDPGDPQGQLNSLEIIGAFELEEKDGLRQQPDYGSRSYFRWTDSDVLGTDPDELSEELGEKIPDLLKVALDNDNIHNIPDSYEYLPYAQMVSANFSPYMQQGFINVKRDADGLVRRVPLVLATKYYNSEEKKLKSVFMPSFALLSCMAYWKADIKDVEVDFGNEITIRTSAGTHNIPIDYYGRILVNFDFKPDDLPYVSFKDIDEYGSALSQSGESAFAGPAKTKLDYIKKATTGKICLVGLTFTGNGDEGPTALHPHIPYVYVHAAAINSILQQRYLLEAPSWIIMLILLLTSFVAIVAGSNFGIRSFTLVCVLLAFQVIVGSFASVYYSWYFFPAFFLSMQIAILFVSIILIRYFAEEKEKAKIRNMFATMVSAKVLTYMDRNPDSFSLKGHKAQATIMFSDVAGFTSISEDLNPPRLVQLLNEYLTPMTDIILENGGYVDKYEGDAIMAEWGVPFPDEKHATQACYACLEQQDKLDEIRQRLYDEFGHTINVRMGLNSGEVAAGNMGSTTRFSYTVMGDAVNLAARLEPTNKVYGTLIMIGESTYALAKDDIECRLLDKV
ncbi:MAG: CHASE2 domain-containing protein, partial [Lentisphaeraceae bacterium]|nr:CHASE2 domain-containing protein [Lentisphaeraceae bacterium]